MSKDSAFERDCEFSAGQTERSVSSDLAPRNRRLHAMNEPPVDPRARPRKANAPKMTMARAVEALDRDRAGESQRALR
jgi:hypothetical protein